MELTQNKLIFAHRGASAYAPENTLPAFEMAADMNAFGVELDVHMTKDGKIAVIHDSDITRTADGSGAVKEMTLSEMKQYNFGIKFGDKFGKVEVPTLEDVYNLLKHRGLYINVEIKAAGRDFVRLVHDCTVACGMKDKVIYSSFNHWNLTDMLEYDSEAFVAPLFGRELVKSADYAKLFGAKAIHPVWSQLTEHPELVSRAKELGIRIHTWTVDDPVLIQRFCDFEIGAIITNKPDIALAIAGKE